MHFFYDYNSRELKKIEKKVSKIMDLDIEYSKLSDLEIQNKIFEFKERYENGESLEQLMIEAFAICREATFRVLKKKQYKVQLIGGIILHQGRIAEMKTGEGKTLTELCPAYLNAITGKGVHIITVNEYLAERDKEEMTPLFNFLNLSVGLVLEKTDDKKTEYMKDIVYTTNTQLGFDYLRDNLVYCLEDKVQRELNYVIIDEIDSVLIDEASTPLIISEQSELSNEKYEVINYIVSSLKECDYNKDEKENTIFLSESGIEKIERFFNITNLSETENLELYHIINQSLKANFLMNKDIDYIVKDNEVILIDLSTGRIAEGRRFSDGLHQCLEAKEGVKINSESRTLASITYQSFFKLYNKISGMSGTVKSEEFEFREIYNLDVITVPTNKKIKRIDKKDRIFIDKMSKYKAILNDIQKTCDSGQPILIGTSSIEESEKLSKYLYNNGISHRLLNAKTKKQEAEIVAQAGEFGAITIATNIAGRGTDIKISDYVAELGGLKVIGTERSESVRIDNQLIGRSGRQGDPGESQFFISCEDKLLSVYGENKIKKCFTRTADEEVNIKYAKKYIINAQKTIKNLNYEMRKHTAEYDQILNEHRKIIYKERNEILEGRYIENVISDIILEYIKDIVISIYEDISKVKIKKKKEIFKLNLDYFNKLERDKFWEKVLEDTKIKDKISEDEKSCLYGIWEIYKIINSIAIHYINYFNLKLTNEKIISEETMRNLFINSIDFYWQEHLVEMEHLKMFVRDQSYAQKKPIDIYKFESGILVKELFNKIRRSFIISLYNYVD